jgi:hypothetical protein
MLGTYRVWYEIRRVEAKKIEVDSIEEAERMAHGDDELGDALVDGEELPFETETRHVEALEIEEERDGEFVSVRDFTGPHLEDVLRVKGLIE